MSLNILYILYIVGQVFWGILTVLILPHQLVCWYVYLAVFTNDQLCNITYIRDWPLAWEWYSTNRYRYAYQITSHYETKLYEMTHRCIWAVEAVDVYYRCKIIYSWLCLCYTCYTNTNSIWHYIQWMKSCYYKTLKQLTLFVTKLVQEIENM